MLAALGAACAPGGVVAQPAPAQQEPPAPVDVTGATVIEYDAQKQEYRFQGTRVVVIRGTQRLEGPEIFYDAAARRAVLPQRGTISTPEMSLTADRITAELGTRHLVAEGRVAGRFLDEGVWTSLAAGRVIADDRPDLRRAEADGDVVAIRADQELHGDRIVYDRLTRLSTVEGHAVMIRGTDRLRADRVLAHLDTRDAEATGHVLLDREKEQMHGSADRATYSGRTETAVLIGHAVITRPSVPAGGSAPGAGRDSVTGDQITVHLDRNEAVAEGHAQVVAYPRESSPEAVP